MRSCSRAPQSCVRASGMKQGAAFTSLRCALAGAVQNCGDEIKNRRAGQDRPPRNAFAGCEDEGVGSMRTGSRILLSQLDGAKAWRMYRAPGKGLIPERGDIG